MGGRKGVWGVEMVTVEICYAYRRGEVEMGGEVSVCRCEGVVRYGCLLMFPI